MNKKRISCMILVICMLLQLLPVNTFAAPTDMTPVYVQACYVPDGNMEALRLLNNNGEAYISAEDLARLADMKVEVKDGKLTFSKETCSFSRTADLGGNSDDLSSYYLPLKSSAEYLYLSYFFHLIINVYFI